MQTEMLEQTWEKLFVDYFSMRQDTHNDASHDLGHFRRVYYTSKMIASNEQAFVDPMVILAAAYFHDIVSLPKNHADNRMSSQYAAIKAEEVLRSMNFPQEKIGAVCHAIRTHSFSAQLQPETVEAKIIQDADRMESLGALGVMRTFYVSGRMGGKPFDPDDLYAEKRALDDKTFGLDHFFVKLFKLPSQLQTQGGRYLANKRVEFLHDFIKELEDNIKQGFGGALAVVWACYRAGQQNFQLFDLLNPLALNRPLNPTLFAMDQLMADRQQFPTFIDKFLSQFQEEIV